MGYDFDFSWDRRHNHRSGTHKRTGKEEAVIVLGASGNGNPDAVLRNLVDGALDAMGWRVTDAMSEIIDEVGEEAAKRLREESKAKLSKRATGKYARGWIYDNSKTYRNKKVAMVRNKAQPQLTHLLEFGHPIVRRGKVVGTADPIEHIQPVNEWAQKELIRRFEEREK